MKRLQRRGFLAAMDDLAKRGQLGTPPRLAGVLGQDTRRVKDVLKGLLSAHTVLRLPRQGRERPYELVEAQSKELVADDPDVPGVRMVPDVPSEPRGHGRSGWSMRSARSSARGYAYLCIVGPGVAEATPQGGENSVSAGRETPLEGVPRRLKARGAWSE